MRKRLREMYSLRIENEIVRNRMNKLFLFFCCCSVFLISSLPGFSQSGSTDSLFREFRNDILIEQELYNGVVIWDDDTRITYYRLLLNATADSLEKYTDDSVAAVRGIMFRALINKNAHEKILQETMDRHTHDTVSFAEKGGTVVFSFPVKSYMKISYDFRDTLHSIDFASEIKKMQEQHLIKISVADHGLIRMEDLLKLDSLTCVGMAKELVSISLILGKKEIPATGCHLNKKMKRRIRAARKGDVICFDNIRVRVPDDTVRRLPSICLRVK